MAEADSNLLFIAWSTITFQRYEALFTECGMLSKVLLARDILPSTVSTHSFAFLERHYDPKKEKALLESLAIGEIIAHFSLDDPTFALFNARRIKKVMKSMHHQEGVPKEPLQHKMIDKSIERVLRKLNEEPHLSLPRRTREWAKSL